MSLLKIVLEVIRINVNAFVCAELWIRMHNRVLRWKETLCKNLKCIKCLFAPVKHWKCKCKHVNDVRRYRASADTLKQKLLTNYESRGGKCPVGMWILEALPALIHISVKKRRKAISSSSVLLAEPSVLPQIVPFRTVPQPQCPRQSHLRARPPPPLLQPTVSARSSGQHGLPATSWVRAWWGLKQ